MNGIKKVRYIGKAIVVHGTYGQLSPGQVFEVSQSDWAHLIGLELFEDAEPENRFSVSVERMIARPSKRTLLKKRGEE